LFHCIFWILFYFPSATFKGPFSEKYLTEISVFVYCISNDGNIYWYFLLLWEMWKLLYHCQNQTLLGFEFVISETTNALNELCLPKLFALSKQILKCPKPKCFYPLSSKSIYQSIVPPISIILAVLDSFRFSK
jgi:hypothetical protein